MTNVTKANHSTNGASATLSAAAAVRSLLDHGAVVGGCPPGSKNPKSSAGKLGSWHLHQQGRHLDEGQRHLLAGTEGWGVYLPPGGVPMQNGFLACADVDTTAVDVAALLRALPFPLLDYRKPGDPNRAHTWFLLDERIGSVELFLHGLKIGEWRAATKDGRSVGVGMRLYDGEPEALVQALEGSGAPPCSLPRTLQPYPWSKAVKKARGALKNLPRGCRNPSLLEHLRPLQDWIGEREAFEHALADDYASLFSSDELSKRDPAAEVARALDTVRDTPCPTGGKAATAPASAPTPDECPLPEILSGTPILPHPPAPSPRPGRVGEDGYRLLKTPEEVASSFSVSEAAQHHVYDTHGPGGGQWATWFPGAGWRPDPKGASIKGDMARFSSSRYGVPDPEHPKRKLMPDPIRGGAANIVNQAYALAGGYAGMTLYGSDWDANPNLVGLPDAKVHDLASGETRPQSPEDMIRRTTPTLPGDPAQSVLGQIVHGSFGDGADGLERHLGSILFGAPMGRGVAFIPGKKGSGKSLLLRLLLAALGVYVGTIEAKAVCTAARKEIAHTGQDRARRLRGVRIATVSEWPRGAQLDPERFNEATGHDATVERGVGEWSASSLPTYSMVIVLNAMPSIDRVGDPEALAATFDRTRIWPFTLPVPKPLAAQAWSRLNDPTAQANDLAWLLHAGQRFVAEGHAPLTDAMRGEIESWWIKDGS